MLVELLARCNRQDAGRDTSHNEIMRASFDADLTNALGKVPLFSSLRPSQLESLANASRVKKQKKGAVVVEEGEPGHSLYIVLKGRVGIRSTDPSGEFVYIAERGEGESFGEFSLFDGRPRSNDVVALQDCQFVIIERSEFIRVVSAHAEIALKIMATLTERLREASSGLIDQKPVKSRLSSYLTALAKHSGQMDAKGRLYVRLDGTRQEIAERIRARRETVSRELSSLQEAGLVRISGKEVLIRDLGRLERLAG